MGPLSRRAAWVASVLVVLGASLGATPTVHGLTGLVRVPTAEMPPDGTMRAVWTPSQGAESLAMGGPATHVVAVQTRPNIETAYAVGRMRLHGDLTLGGKLALTRASARTKLAVGVVDLKRTGVGEQTYFAVATHRFADDRAALTLGGVHGGSSGVVGGISAEVTDGVELQAEYDSRRINAGMAVRVGDRLTLHLVDLDTGLRLSTCYATALAAPTERRTLRPIAVTADEPLDVVADRARTALATLGFEDVRAAMVPAPEGPTLAAQYEDRMHLLSTADGIAAALEALAATATDDVTSLRAVVTRRGVPVHAVTVPAAAYRRYLRGELAAPAMAEATDVALLPDAVPGAVANRSAGHADLVLGPGLSTLLGTETEVLATGWFARAEAVAMPLPRVQTMARVQMPVGGPLVADGPSGPHVDRAQAMVMTRLGRTALAQAHVGRFVGDRDGAALEVAAPVGASGLLHAVAATVDCDGVRQRCLLADYRRAFPAQQMQVRLVGGRFLDGDTGAGVDVLRFYREVAIGVGLRDTQRGRLMEIRAITPLSPRRQREMPRALRVRTPDVFDYRMRSLVVGINSIRSARAMGNELALAGDLVETAFDRGRGTAAGLRAELYRRP